MCLLSSVEFLECACRNDDIWFLYLVLKISKLLLCVCVYIYIYIKLQTVLFRPSGPHQCSANEGMEVKLEKPPQMLHACGNI